MHLNEIPNELLLHITGYLADEDLLCFRLVNRRTYTWLAETTPPQPLKADGLKFTANSNDVSACFQGKRTDDNGREELVPIQTRIFSRNSPSWKIRMRAFLSLTHLDEEYATVCYEQCDFDDQSMEFFIAVQTLFKWNAFSLKFTNCLDNGSEKYDQLLLQYFPTILTISFYSNARSNESQGKPLVISDNIIEALPPCVRKLYATAPYMERVPVTDRILDVLASRPLETIVLNCVTMFTLPKILAASKAIFSDPQSCPESYWLGCVLHDNPWEDEEVKDHGLELLNPLDLRLCHLIYDAAVRENGFVGIRSMMGAPTHWPGRTYDVSYFREYKRKVTMLVVDTGAEKS